VSVRYSRYVVAYDVSDDRERVKVDKVLAGYGFRAQRSVYVVEVNKSGFRQLEGSLTSLRIETGGIAIWRIQTVSSPVFIGKPPMSPDDEIVFIV
jgi:CRISPR-associated protein Cas2